MIANHPIYGGDYSYHIRGDRSLLSTRLPAKTGVIYKKPLVFLARHD